MGFSKGSGFVSVMVLVALVSVAVVSGQELPSCAAKLLPCVQYLNSTTPSETCCSSIRDAIQNDLECLCNLFNNPDFFKSLNINITQALQLPQHCGITADAKLCQGTPGSNNGVTGMAWIGMSGLAGLLFLWTYIMI
ncbi:non-specific lipid transfer protein GPI-anchored 9 isoform X4 [Magnolia sinica]|uniref:non-specific lipid transfer protein GPI-anchored 9 isoform X4 n=1 Tax=Magnolia sinica TaxID=86752 RepID=UPI00265A1618|nr:non-specific lipid transfer protein GPI-anchored 9 isoform X4 [Magnolia sinica]